MENSKKNFEGNDPETPIDAINNESKLTEDKAWMFQELASKKEEVSFSTETSTESQSFADAMLEELHLNGLSLEGFDWNRVKEAGDAEEIVEILKEYLESKGADVEKFNTHVKGIKQSPIRDLLRQTVVLVALLIGSTIGGTPSEAAPLTGHEISEENMKKIIGSEIFKADTDLAKQELPKYQEEYQDYFNELKHKHPNIQEITIAHILVSQKIVEEGEQIVPAVIADVELKIITKDGHEIILNDKSYKNINDGYVLRDGAVHSTVDYLVKNGWISASNVAASGAWEKDRRSEFKNRLIRESIYRIGEQMTSQHF